MVPIIKVRKTMNKLVRLAAIALVLVGSVGMSSQAQARPMLCGAIERVLDLPYDNSPFQQWAYNYYFSRCYGE
jgi:hypothetical protein